jgi:hypothetical protein
MTYKEFLKRGNVNEIVDAILDQLQTELRYRHKGFPQEIVRDALIEFFERGRLIGVSAATKQLIGDHKVKTQL